MMQATEIPIYDSIYALVRLIPYGRVSTYGAIAAALGMASGARQVGYALNKCHHESPPVPAHRVVNRIGLLTGRVHFDPPEAMQQLLEAEGVVVTDNQVKEFSNLFWDPQRELGL